MNQANMMQMPSPPISRRYAMSCPPISSHPRIYAISTSLNPQNPTSILIPYRLWIPEHLPWIHRILDSHQLRIRGRIIVLRVCLACTQARIHVI